MGVPLIPNDLLRVFQGIISSDFDANSTEGFYEEDEPEADVRVIPTWMPPLVNFTSGMCIFQWFRFTFNNDYDIDLTECGKDVPGRLPAWLMHSEEPLSEIFKQTVMDSDENSCEAQYPNVDWALKEGLAPGQPFLVEFQPPRVSGGGTDYNGDYNDVDVDYWCSIVRVMPKSRAGTLKAWEHTLRRIQHEHVKHARLVRHFTQQGLARKAYWQVVRDRTHMPGLGLKLVVENPGDAHHTILRQLEIAKGHDNERPYVDFLDRKLKELKDPKDAEQYRRAFDNLLQDFIRKHPHEDVAPVLALAHVEYSSWDYLSLMECRDSVEVGDG